MESQPLRRWAQPPESPAHPMLTYVGLCLPMVFVWQCWKLILLCKLALQHAICAHPSSRLADSIHCPQPFFRQAPISLLYPLIPVGTQPCFLRVHATGHIADAEVPLPPWLPKPLPHASPMFGPRHLERIRLDDIPFQSHLPQAARHDSAASSLPWIRSPHSQLEVRLVSFDPVKKGRISILIMTYMLQPIREQQVTCLSNLAVCVPP
jgi:hypothetical protein